MLATLSDALPLTQALREFFPPGRSGNTIALSTACRWIHRGVLSPSGRRVRLSAVRVGGVTYVRPSDAERFLLALNEGMPEDVGETDADVARRGKAASQALEALGI